ncbi:arylsulfatase [Draconibacterium orientale]|uniref:arylsulfatase n=1 Tax=Draconibacterium orientale TaxID=1168034 RepID=UPI002ABD8AC4|nr:arylsulfatase [Draconibacterium orientale]
MKKLINGLLIGIMLFSMACTPTKKEQEKKVPESPNVILVLVDDMGYGDLSFYGQKTLSTPIIDKMATEGMHFTNMYTGSTVCAPSRASLMTGKHTGHTNVRGNLPAQLLSDDELTIAKVFKNAGYATGGIGKWGIGHPPPYDDPQKKGFDYFYGYINMWHAHNFYPEFLIENGEKVPLKNKTTLVDGKNPWADMPEGTGVAAVREEYVHNLFDKKAIDFIEKNKDNKFFLYMAYNVPHANNEGGPFAGDGMEVPDYYEFAEKDWPQPEKGFASMIRNIDNSVGMLLDKVKELGLDDNTMVIFCSDNGPHQEGRHIMEFFNSNRELRGMKRDFYDGGVKTPFIVRWPGVIKEGTSSDQVFAFWDFLPTFTDLVDVEKPKETDGISFLPTLLGQEQNKEHDYLYWEFFELGGKQAILKDNWKAVKLNVRGPKEKVIFELYNLESDPEETNNVAEQYPALVKEFEELFLSARDEFAVTPLFESDGKEVETPF